MLSFPLKVWQYGWNSLALFYTLLVGRFRDADVEEGVAVDDVGVGEVGPEEFEMGHSGEAALESIG